MNVSKHSSAIRRSLIVMSAMLLFLILVAAMLLTPTRPVTSLAPVCTPPPGGLPVYTTAERVANAEIVLEGTITKVVEEMNDVSQVATVSVTLYYKGYGPAEVTIDGFGPGSLCLSYVQEGDHRVFYAHDNPMTGLSATYLSQFDAVDSVSPERTMEIIEAVGRTPLPPYPPRLYLATIYN